jgi:hypothetical protein
VEEGTRLAVLDRAAPRLVPITKILYPGDAGLDMALLPGVLDGSTKQFPILTSGLFRVGEDVGTYGYYSQTGHVAQMVDGYFKGHVVSFRTDRYVTITLSYPVIEGLSGSYVTTAHNGAKLVGMCFGSESQRVLAQEVVEIKEGERERREEVHRIVEFGMAYRSEVIETFCNECGVQPVVTDDHFDPEQLG